MRLSSIHPFRILAPSILFGALAFCSGCIALMEDPDKIRETPVTAEVLALIVAGQGGSEFGTPQGGGEAGAEGTQLRSDDGRFTVTIPPGAMQDGDTTDFSITRYNLSSEALPSGFLPVSYVYQVSPSYVFQKKVRVTIAVDESEISANNLQISGTRGFSYSTSSSEEDAGRLSGWEAFESNITSQEVQFATRTFSLFGAGSPVPGNQAPVITGAFYYFKPGCSYLPYRVRARVIEPDGETVSVYLNNGPAAGATNLITMNREGSTDWYSADLFYESMDASGIQFQVLAVDASGASTFRPNQGTFEYPADAANPVYDSNFDPDSDGDGLLCAWEEDYGFDDQNPGDASGITDTDGDGLPDSEDHTPAGEANPTIDTMEIYPEEAIVEIGETITVGVTASLAGSPRFVQPVIAVTGNSLNGNPVGTITDSSFEAEYPGVAGVQAFINSFSATASIRVRDSLSPQEITDLVANSYSHTAITLQWTAPGNDESYGTAAGYQVRLSSSPITSTAECTGAIAVSHSLTPSSAGIQEHLEVNGLSPNQEYFFCILAYDAEGNFNDWTQGSVSAQTQPVPDTTAPTPVTDLTATATGPTTVELAWTAVGDDASSGAATAYEIRRSLSPISNDLECSNASLVPNSLGPQPAGNPVTQNVSNLSDGTVYYFCVRAFDEVNNRSTWTGTVSATTPSGNDAPIADAGADTIGGTGQTIALDASDSTDPDAAHCGASSGLYTYEWSFLSVPPTSALDNADIANSNSLQAEFIPDVGGTYILQFSFTDDAGSCEGGDRTDVDTVSIEVSDLLPPVNLQGTLLQGGIELTWDSVAATTGYRVYFSTASPVTESDSMVEATDPDTLLTNGFQDNQTYYFAVSSIDSSNESELSSEVMVSVPQTTCGDAIIEFPEQCDDGNADDGDGCGASQCTIELGFDCDNSSNPSVCTGPYDLGLFGAGDSMSPESGPALAPGEQQHYWITFTESITLSMSVTASIGDPDLRIGQCEGSYTTTYEGVGNESFSNNAFAPGCYVVTVEARSSMPSGFTLQATIDPP